VLVGVGACRCRLAVHGLKADLQCVLSDLGSLLFGICSEKLFVWVQAGPMRENFTPYKGWEDFDPNNTLVLTARDGESLMLTPQQVQQLTWEEFKDLWRVRPDICLANTLCIVREGQLAAKNN
jgi:hypothetical protein